MNHRSRIAFALLFSCSAAFAADGKTPDHTAIVMVSGELPALEEDVYMFNSRSGYRASAVFSVGVKKRPDPHKEYILCHSSVAWSGGGLGLEELYDEKGEVNEWSIRVTADRAAQWGTEHAVEAKVSFYETLENPPPGEAHSHSQLAEASDSVTVVAPEVKIKSISFNHTPGDSAGDGIDLRESYAGPDIVAPEWTSGGNAKPVAYRAGIMPTVKVDFDLKPDRLDSVRVKAEEGTKGFTLCGGLAEAWGPASNASFAGAGVVEKKVDKGDLKWTWSATGFNGIAARGWDEFQITNVLTYKILGKPILPWKTELWEDALRFVIETCETKGTTTKSGALVKLTTALYRQKQYREHPKCIETENQKETGVFLYSDFMASAGANCTEAALGLCVSAYVLGIPIAPIIERNASVSDTNNWKFHCYSVFNESNNLYVYDSCRWGRNTIPVTRMPLVRYRTLLNPEGVNAAEYITNIEIKGIK